MARAMVLSRVLSRPSPASLRSAPSPAEREREAT
jgi:hypothetical protein